MAAGATIIVHWKAKDGQTTLGEEAWYTAGSQALLARVPDGLVGADMTVVSATLRDEHGARLGHAGVGPRRVQRVADGLQLVAATSAPDQAAGGFVVDHGGRSVTTTTVGAVRIVEPVPEVDMDDVVDIEHFGDPSVAADVEVTP